jgi:hypothetical protein
MGNISSVVYVEEKKTMTFHFGIESVIGIVMASCSFIRLIVCHSIYSTALRVSLLPLSVYKCLQIIAHRHSTGVDKCGCENVGLLNKGMLAYVFSFRPCLS